MQLYGSDLCLGSWFSDTKERRWSGEREVGTCLTLRQHDLRHTPLLTAPTRTEGQFSYHDDGGDIMFGLKSQPAETTKGTAGRGFAPAWAHRTKTHLYVFWTGAVILLEQINHTDLKSQALDGDVFFRQKTSNSSRESVLTNKSC